MALRRWRISRCFYPRNLVLKTGSFGISAILFLAWNIGRCVWGYIKAYVCRVRCPGSGYQCAEGELTFIRRGACTVALPRDQRRLTPREVWLCGRLDMSRGWACTVSPAVLRKIGTAQHSTGGHGRAWHVRLVWHGELWVWCGVV